MDKHKKSFSFHFLCARKCQTVYSDCFRNAEEENVINVEIKLTFLQVQESDNDNTTCSYTHSSKSQQRRMRNNMAEFNLTTRNAITSAQTSEVQFLSEL